MPPTLFNQDDDQIENFKGHVEIKDGVTQYKYGEILSWSVFTRFDSEKHYGTNGGKKKTALGDSSTYELRVKRDASLYDTATPPSQVRTISHYKNLGYGSPRALPEIELKGVSESNASANAFVVDHFTATVENIDEIREEGKGVEEVVISGEILTHVDNLRQVAAP
jgi:hypothetical protein